MKLVIGKKYHWKRTELVYLGREEYDGLHRFALVSAPTDLWCEMFDSGLKDLEETVDDTVSDKVEVDKSELVALLNAVFDDSTTRDDSWVYARQLWYKHFNSEKPIGLPVVYEHIATVQDPSPNKRGGEWISSEDYQKLVNLPDGTKLYVVKS